jgi:hypothetical protein
MATLRYPNEIIEKTTDWFRVGISSYIAGGNASINETANQFLGSSTGTEFEYIILPMPSNIQDGNSVSYGEDKLNTIAAAAVGGITDAMSNFEFDNIPKSLTDTKTAIENALTVSNLNAGVAKKLITKTLAAEAVSIFGGNTSIDSLLARESGTIFNPNMELLFNGVTLRTFRFSFKMTPRDNNESANIRKIIYVFKKNMAPKGGQGQLFLETPNVFNLSYKKGSNDHPFLHKFKPCFLKDMSVNYTGENTYATYSDGTPISMTMDLTFQEMFPIYASEYGNFDDSSATQGVGF